MRTLPADAVQAKLDNIIDDEHFEPLMVTRDGQDVAALLSAADYDTLLGAGHTRQRTDGPDRTQVKRQLHESFAKHGAVYKALARWEAEHDRDGTPGA